MGERIMEKRHQWKRHFGNRKVDAYMVTAENGGSNKHIEGSNDEKRAQTPVCARLTDNRKLCQMPRKMEKIKKN